MIKTESYQIINVTFDITLNSRGEYIILPNKFQIKGKLRKVVIANRSSEPITNFEIWVHNESYRFNDPKNGIKVFDVCSFSEDRDRTELTAETSYNKNIDYIFNDYRLEFQGMTIKSKDFTAKAPEIKTFHLTVSLQYIPL